VLMGLIRVEDRTRNTAQFWALWSLFAERVRVARWLPRVDESYSDGVEMLSAIFLATGWKEHVRHWESVEGYAERVDALFDALPVSPTVLDRYARYLY